MSTTTNLNGKRKSLADQLDRLDGIIDTLGEGLNETVADVVRQAVTVAVQETLQTFVREILTNPQVLAQFAALAAAHLPQQAPQAPATAQTQATPAPAAQAAVQPARAGCRGLLVGAAVAVCERLRPAAQAAHQRCRRWLGVARGALASLWQWARRHPGATAAAVAVGAVVAWLSYEAGPTISSALLGLIGGAASLAGAALAPLFRLFRVSPPASDS